MEFSGKTLVTGAAGFLGSHVIENLVRNGIKVRASDLPVADASFFKSMDVEFVGADLTRPETLPPLFEGDIDRIFHLGAVCNLTTPFKKLCPINVDGVDLITDLAMKSKVKRFIHVSSTSLYGYYTGSPFTEKSDRNPGDDYGRSKKAGEDIVLNKIKQGLPATILRPCTVYGPRCTDGAGKAFSRPTAITAIPGNGNQLLSNIRAEDAAAAILYLSKKDDTMGEVYNIAEDSNPTLEEALVLAAKTYKSKVPTMHLPIGIVKAFSKIDGFVSGIKNKIPDLEYNAVKYLDRDYVVDNTKLKKTGFKLQYPDFFESMKQLGEWYWNRNH